MLPLQSGRLGHSDTKAPKAFDYTFNVVHCFFMFGESDSLLFILSPALFVSEDNYRPPNHSPSPTYPYQRCWVSNFSSSPHGHLFFSRHVQNETRRVCFHPSHRGPHTWVLSQGCLGVSEFHHPSAPLITLLKGCCLILIIFLLFRTEKK